MNLANVWPWALAAAGALYLLKGNAPAGDLLKQLLGFLGLGSLGVGGKPSPAHDMATVRLLQLSGRLAGPARPSRACDGARPRRGPQAVRPGLRPFFLTTETRRHGGGKQKKVLSSAQHNPLPCSVSPCLRGE
jgi:hypothetical protein